MLCPYQRRLWVPPEENFGVLAAGTRGGAGPGTAVASILHASRAPLSQCSLRAVIRRPLYSPFIRFIQFPSRRRFVPCFRTCSSDHLRAPPPPKKTRPRFFHRVGNKVCHAQTCRPPHCPVEVRAGTVPCHSLCILEVFCRRRAIIAVGVRISWNQRAGGGNSRQHRRLLMQCKSRPHYRLYTAEQARHGKSLSPLPHSCESPTRTYPFAVESHGFLNGLA